MGRACFAAGLDRLSIAKMFASTQPAVGIAPFMSTDDHLDRPEGWRPRLKSEPEAVFDPSRCIKASDPARTSAPIQTQSSITLVELSPFHGLGNHGFELDSIRRIVHPQKFGAAAPAGEMFVKELRDALKNSGLDKARERARTPPAARQRAHPSARPGLTGRADV